MPWTVLGFPCGSAGKEPTCNVGDLGLIPGFGKIPWEGKGYPRQYSGLENSTECIVHGVAESDMTDQLSLHMDCAKFEGCDIKDRAPTLPGLIAN